MIRYMLIIILFTSAALLAGTDADRTTQTFEPSTLHYDWIELTSGEWLKGYLKSLDNKTVEFDSEKLDMQVFDFSDIRKIRLHRRVSVSIFIPDSIGEGYFGYRNRTRTLTGRMRVDNDTVTIEVGKEIHTFPREQLISIGFGDSRTAWENWSGRMTFSFDVRTGNSKRIDYTAQGLLKRQTTDTRLTLDYFGNILSTNDTETTNDHRLREVFNIYLTDVVYITPVYAEYYTDKYQNIANRYTVGLGAGYTLMDTATIEWDGGFGPGYIYTDFDTVEAGRKSSSSSMALSVRTNFEMEISNDIDFTVNYALTYSNQETGGYKHHMIIALNNSLTSWFDVDISLVWDYIANPETSSNGETPYNNDIQLLVGLGIEF